METQSPSTGIKRLDGEIRQILRNQDVSRLPAKQRGLLANLDQDLVDARKYVNAYELSETREEQLDNAKVARSWLSKARKCILSASEHDIFGAVDVASLSAQIDTIKDNLKWKKSE